jgi:hypothetical protein
MKKSKPSFLLRYIILKNRFGQVKDQEFGLVRWNISDASLVEIAQAGLQLKALSIVRRGL